MRHSYLYTALIASTILGFSGAANAAGFYIQEQSASGLGAAFAGQAAMPRDASVLFYNPAGITHLKGTQANVGVHFIKPSADIDDTGTVNAPGLGDDGKTPYSVSPVPNAYISHQVTDKFWLGFGVSAPFGLGSDYGDTWFGRFDSTETELTTLDFQPTAAYKVNDWLSVGGTVIIEYAQAELKNRVFGGVTEGTQTLEGDDVSVGYNIGLMADVTDTTRIGLDYRSQLRQQLDGRLVIEGAGAANANVPGTVSLDLPDIATFSVAQKVHPQWTLLGSASWFGWNSFDQIRVVTDTGVGLPAVRQEYQNTMAFSVGAEYEYNDQWTFRGGYQYDETPTQDNFRTTRTPDGDRNWFSAGATYNVNDKLSLDLAGTYITVADEEINLSRNAGASTLRADTSGSVGIVALGLNYKF